MLVSDQAPATPGRALFRNSPLAHLKTFEKAEARPSGANDFMTKPFQSLRHLMNRMLGVTSNGKEESAYDYSTLGIGNSESEPRSSVTDIDVQTADTQRLRQVNPEFMSQEAGNAEHDDEYDNSLLDLDGVRGAQSLANDPVLDLDFDTA